MILKHVDDGEDIATLLNKIGISRENVQDRHLF